VKSLFYRQKRPLLWALQTIALFLMVLCLQPANASNYTFPDAMPAGCSGTAGLYTCDTLTLAAGDTIALQAPLPAIITVKANFTTASDCAVNASGLSTSLTLYVKGKITIGSSNTLHAKIIGIQAVTLGEKVIVDGSITSTQGDITVGASSEISGHIASAAAVSLAADVKVSGNVTGAGKVTIDASAVIGQSRIVSRSWRQIFMR
jgi:hypothetical protein